MKSLSFIKPAFLCLTALALNAVSLYAQSSRNVAVSNFTKLSVSAGIEMLITQGTTESAKIVAESDMIDEVVVRKNGNTLSVGWKDNWSFRKMSKEKKAKVYISYKTLNCLEASSGSHIQTVNLLKTDHLEASASSGATVDAKISCRELDLSSSSGASVSLAGSAQTMKVESSSGSTIDAVSLNTTYTKAAASSGADLKINVSKALETRTSSGGNISYKGAAALNDHSNSRNSGVSRIN